MRPEETEPGLHGAKQVIVEAALHLMIRVARRLCRNMGYPITARHVELSMLSCMDDELSQATNKTYMLDLAMAVIHQARQVSLEAVADRMLDRFPAAYPLIWPGEHYKLLAGFVLELKPNLVVEIGTGEGLSVLSMLPFLPVDGSIVTFDLVPWQEYPRTCLQREDFKSGKLRQILADLSDPGAFIRHAEILSRSDLVFMDGPKDGKFESRVVTAFGRMKFDKPPIFVFDDIRLWNMLRFWRDLEWPKLDLTSFGSWCGTGVAQWRRKMP